MAIVVVLAGSYLGYQRLSDSGCTGSVRLTVAATTEIATAVEQTAQSWIQNGANVNGTCIAVTVNPIQPAIMAAAVAGEHRVTLNGVGTAPESVKVPDVWIPDSSTWLLRLKQEAPGFVPTDGKPVAQSPIVVAMPQPVAEQLGWPNKRLGWKDLLTQLTTSTQLRTGVVDPNRDAAGLSGLLALGQAAGAGPQAQAVKVGALKALAQSSSALREDLLQKFPHDPNDIATALSAAPLSEQDVISYDAERPPVPLAALYLDPSPLPLDYPYAIMPEVDLQKSAAATALHQQLNSAAFKNALASAGLRAPDGSVGSGFAAPTSAPEASPAISSDGKSSGGSAAAGQPGAAALSQALGSWSAITLPGRALAVFDVSGSMLKPVPTAGGATRAAVTQAAASGGLALFDDKWAVGVWLFSTDMNGTKPYREIVPISPLSSQRSKIQASISQIVPKRNGNTGLYDTLLAAYQNVQNSWQPGKVNSVLLFTDGVNENDEGITQDTLIARLKQLNDPKRPVRVVIIGIGPEVNRKELETIVKPTAAGGVFIAPDPAKIGEIFLEAIATRTGAN
ncbi:substrate-binding and VWA domain-containing protein [Actinoplanes sp. KI2]|uniref:substrate-binding and VWA domain-containing protein n=1 Tax=Actinoplanes sp. KI2 TaxID=2983315 RepID=UPI0021D569B8|nr:substrate-binding and VWA domain-containing protein [Actinoplanes sp. KI2]MCU7722924.1 substrate-binding and VWA domain-containing protein [Actinoplanes sp. KI2]